MAAEAFLPLLRLLRGGEAHGQAVRAATGRRAFVLRNAELAALSELYVPPAEVTERS